MFKVFIKFGKCSVTISSKIFYYPLGGSDGKESACSAGDPGSILGSGRSPGEGKGNALLYTCLENPMDRPWGCKESDMTEQLTLSLSNISIYVFILLKQV